MQGNLAQALELMMVGMTMVFLILGVVVLTSKSIIFLSNRFYIEPKQELALSKKRATKKVEGKMNPAHIAAMTGAVSFITKGKGKIVSIEKVKLQAK